MKEKITLEYPVNSTAGSLFARLSTASGLRGWFADDVKTEGERGFVFFWGKVSQRAVLEAKKANRYIRFRWADVHGPEGCFGFRIFSSELTGELSLEVTDYAEPEDREDLIFLWNTNIKRLRHNLGAG